MPRIFISYRREDSKHAVGRLHAALKRHVRNPQRDIFMDIDNIPRGVDFVEYLADQVGQCDVMLAVMGPQWITITDPKTGRRRLDNPEDFVRIEVATALERNIPVVPVWLDDTPVPSAEELPDNLKSLARRNGERLSHSSFDQDVARLVRNFPKMATESAKLAPQNSNTLARSTLNNRRGRLSLIGFAIALALVVGGGASVWIVMPNTIQKNGEIEDSNKQAVRHVGVEQAGPLPQVAPTISGTSGPEISDRSSDSRPSTITGPPAVGLSVSQVVEGRSLYQQACAMCHGEAGQGTQMGTALPYDIAKSVVEDKISKGMINPGDRMPPMGAALTSEQIQILASFVAAGLPDK